jgi:hypothetical protein
MQILRLGESLEIEIDTCINFDLCGRKCQQAQKWAKEEWK